MYRRIRRVAAGAGTGLDLTPMIDVVFNLVIFLMLVTDLTQQDLEYLVLPAAGGETDLGTPERLVVNIVDPSSSLLASRGEPGGLPIYFEGRQVRSLDELRGILRLRADPRRFPQPLDPITRIPRSPLGIVNGEPVHPSRVPLLIRCDERQLFGWVQAVMQICGRMPGRDPERELLDSPLIETVEIAVAEQR